VAVVVSTQSSKDEIGIQTLVGDYSEHGENHGKTYYKKLQRIPGHEAIDVYLYYWDERDGADYSGWWFGDQLGGVQVWAKCSSKSPTPPRTGWKIPWDAPKAEPGLLLVDLKTLPSASAGAVSSHGQARGTIPAATMPRRPASGAPTTASSSCDGAGRDSPRDWDSGRDKAGYRGKGDSGGRRTREEPAARDAPKANDQRRPWDSGGRWRGEEEAYERDVQKKRDAEEAQRKRESEDAQRKREAETQKREAREKQEHKDALQAAQDSTASAEDAVNAVVSLAAPLLDDPSREKGEILRRSIAAVEKAAAEAAAAVSSAKNAVVHKLGTAKRYAGGELRKVAVNDFQGLQSKLSAAMRQLGPYKAFKAEFEKSLEAQKAFANFEENLAAAELECEKATAIAAGTADGIASEEDVQTAEKTLSPAKKAIHGMLRGIEEHGAEAPGTKWKKLREQAVQLRQKIDAAFTKLKSQREGITARNAVDEAKAKLDKVNVALGKCSDAEMPFLKGIEVLPADESSKAIAELEATSAEAATAVHDLVSFLRLRAAEAKQSAHELAKVSVAELDELQQKAEVAKGKVATVKKETAERKTAAMLAAVVEAVGDAEATVRRFMMLQLRCWWRTLPTSRSRA
jgi:hypothetical protein